MVFIKVLSKFLRSLVLKLLRDTNSQISAVNADAGHELGRTRQRGMARPAASPRATKTPPGTPRTAEPVGNSETPSHSQPPCPLFRLKSEAKIGEVMCLRGQSPQSLICFCSPSVPSQGGL